MNVPLELLEFSLIKKGLQKRDLVNEPYLEVGCGDGFNLERFSKLGMRGTAIDLSHDAVALVREKHFPGVQLIAGDFLDEGTVFQQPKIIFMLNLLEHIRPDVDFMRKAARLLPTGGYLVIAVPGLPHTYGFADANAGHIRRYDQRELREKLTSAGFSIDEWLNVGFPVNRSYTWLFNFLNRKRPQTLDEAQTLDSGIRHKENYYGGGFDAIAKIAFPILKVAIQLDRLFVHTGLGSDYVVFAKKT